MNKKFKFFAITVLVALLIYINRSEIQNLFSKLPFFGNSTSVSDESDEDNRGSYEYYYCNGGDKDNTLNNNTPWRMNKD